MNKYTDEFKPKSINFEPLEKLLKGTEKVARAVGSTMGPHGRTVISEVPTQLFPKVTKDGVSVAQQIVLKDQIENLGAQLLIQAAFKQVQETGDGTTLTVILAHEIFKLGVKELKDGKSSRTITEEIEKDIKDICEYIQKVSIKCETKEQLESVATISSNGDKELGKMIAEAILTVGKYGSVECEKSATRDNKLEYQDGYQFNRGLDYPEFCNIGHNLELEKPLILVTDNHLQWARELFPVLEKINKKYKNNQPRLILIAPEVKGEVLAVLLDSIRTKKAFIPYIRPEGIAEEQRHSLQDIAALTGATFISMESGIKLSDVELTDLGTCEHIKSNHKKTSIIQNKSNCSKRIEQLKLLIETSELEYDKNLAKKSLAKLTGGIAILKVGGSNESEQNEIKDRVDDAILASRAAKEMGIINGGGMELAKCPLNLGSIMAKAIFKPIEQIMLNWDLSFEYFMDKIDRLNSYPDKKCHETMIEKGVIDPAKVVITALHNASSVARLMINCSASITLDE